ncbi:MAG: alkaline phosphatase family protein [Thermodesulfovibrionales bacterium]|nr:alkaline phosphatase family protein [Thermodesulfovibrionales bacterium]
MNRRTFVKSLGAAVFLAKLPLHAQAASNSFLWFGIDGADIRVLQDMMSAGRLPVMSGLIAQGFTLNAIDNHGPTNTGNNWPRAMTGLDPDQTGAMGNWYFYDEERRDGKGFWPFKWNSLYKKFRHMNFWIREIPYRHTFFHGLQRVGIKTGFFVSKPFNRGPLGAIYKNADGHYLHSPSYGPEYLQNLSDRAKAFIANQTDKGHSFFCFVHTNPDKYGHMRGGRSERYFHEYERSDRVLGEMLALMPVDTPIIISSDHGFDEFDEGHGTHHNAPYAFMLTNLPIRDTVINQRDIACTVLDWYGINWQNCVPMMRGKSLL